MNDRIKSIINARRLSVRRVINDSEKEPKLRGVIEREMALGLADVLRDGLDYERGEYPSGDIYIRTECYIFTKEQIRELIAAVYGETILPIAKAMHESASEFSK